MFCSLSPRARHFLFSSSPLQPRMSFVSTGAHLSKDDVERFSRQIMVEGIGAQGMHAIRRARVVCIGLGGLGSTIALYLAAAGVGELVLVDHDEVDLSNLHRQVIHTSDRVGVKKVESARASCLRLFPAARITAVAEGVSLANIASIVARGDVVVDGTDNVASRYLINDAAMRCGKPLVSGSAMRWEGQLSVYGYAGSPCYRCLFPVPPPAAAVGSCNDTGVVGPLPGMIGCLQALETLKVITGAGETLAGRLFLFDGLRFTARVVRLRGKQPTCEACGTAAAALAPRREYEGECCAVGAAYSARLLPLPSQRCTPAAFAAARDRNVALLPTVLAAAAGVPGREKGLGATAPWALTVDVRVPIQYDMAHLPFAVNVPLSTLRQQLGLGGEEERPGRQATFQTLVRQWVARDVAAQLCHRHSLTASESEKVARGHGLPVQCTLYFICRRGVASAEAAQLFFQVFGSQDATLKEAVGGVAGEKESTFTFTAVNVDGGLNAYHHHVDKEFPYY
ncbi:adenylyltransferase and sulfurtransferase [Strigomonas culicis]|uniref:Adenylyltransferase and sulfurtransferase n=1 Tax=Strigomonas culicis TaxID=28005 RepID=S9UC66_9TRYP|nr:adenylyltransferase and sulfurtransferase [Strigomonas culicis]EPY26339.1 adenylyltransferase and sulfurtransferase [Strigomonas culicis]|eukprot:EPY22680.1 adenylyltransferase and sulfurtransferase [Strigomonas culicis]